MITHYTAITWISAMAMLIMFFCAKNSQFISDYRKGGFQLLSLVILVTDLAEWLAASLVGADAAWCGVHVAAKFTELLLTPAVPVIAMAAINGEKVKRWKLIPVGMNAALQVASLWTGWVFTVDAENGYTRGPLYLLYTALFIFEVILLGIHCLRFSRRYQYANVAFLVLINLLILLAVFMEFYAPYLHLDWACVSYAVILFYIYCEQLIHQIDPLTGLLNRRSFSCAISETHTAVTIVFFDVDHFKDINDIYGHQFGDECLLSVAQEIRNVFEHYGYCYRYGGDEFCVILHKNVENADELLSDYFARIQSLRKREARIPFVSAGYAGYDSKKETIDDAIQRADEMMYRYKELHREAHSV